MQMPIAYMNAAGWAKTVEQVQLLSTVPLLTHVVLGSFTPEAKPGSSGGTNFWVGPDGTATNSIQLKNGGAPYLAKHGRQMVDTLNEADKKAVISIAAETPEDYALMARIAADIGADVIEVNAGCPNVYHDGKRGPIASYDEDALLNIVGAMVMEQAQHQDKTPWWLKVSPMANPLDLEWIAKVVKSSNCSALVATNTFPAVSLYHDDGRPFLDVANNYGGMSGTALKPTALSNCRRYRELLPEIPIIGVGGIDSGRDVSDYVVHAGVSGVQVGTAFFQNEDRRALNRIAEQYLTDYYVHEDAVEQV
jgi:dihydroorotate dehydrogenase (fumarate)